MSTGPNIRPIYILEKFLQETGENWPTTFIQALAASGVKTFFDSERDYIKSNSFNSTSLFTGFRSDSSPSISQKILLLMQSWPEIKKIRQKLEKIKSITNIEAMADEGKKILFKQIENLDQETEKLIKKFSGFDGGNYYPPGAKETLQDLYYQLATFYI